YSFRIAMICSPFVSCASSSGPSSKPSSKFVLDQFKGAMSEKPIAVFGSARGVAGGVALELTWAAQWRSLYLLDYRASCRLQTRSLLDLRPRDSRAVAEPVGRRFLCSGGFTTSRT